MPILKEVVHDTCPHCGEEFIVILDVEVDDVRKHIRVEFDVKGVL